MSNLRLAEISLLEGKADDAMPFHGLHQRSQSLYFPGSPFPAGPLLFNQARLEFPELDRSVLVVQNLCQWLALNLLRGVAALEQDHPDDASCVKRYPGRPSALYYQGVAYIKERNFRGASFISTNFAEKPAFGMGGSHAA